LNARTFSAASTLSRRFDQPPVVEIGSPDIARNEADQLVLRAADIAAPPVVYSVTVTTIVGHLFR